MARYCVTFSENDDWGASAADRFTTRPPADARLEEARAAGRFARLVRWEGGNPVEVARINGGLTPPLTQSPRESAITNRSTISTGNGAANARNRDSSSPQSNVMVADSNSRLQTLKLVIEIVVGVIAIIGGVSALIWKSR